jgi:hypothetical protein
MATACLGGEEAHQKALELVLEVFKRGADGVQAADFLGQGR